MDETKNTNTGCSIEPKARVTIGNSYVVPDMVNVMTDSGYMAVRTHGDDTTVRVTSFDGDTHVLHSSTSASPTALAAYKAMQEQAGIRCGENTPLLSSQALLHLGKGMMDAEKAVQEKQAPQAEGSPSMAIPFSGLPNPLPTLSVYRPMPPASIEPVFWKK